MALAGCSSSGNDNPSNTGGNTGGLGGGSTAPGGGNETYKIGFQGALSGDNKQLGINEVNSFKLAVKEANDSGELPFTLDTVISDDAVTTPRLPAPRSSSSTTQRSSGSSARSSPARPPQWARSTQMSTCR